MLAKFINFYEMYFRLGVIDDSSNGMEWMSPDYDHRTFKEITHNSTVSVFLKNLIDLLSVDAPNMNLLAHELGIFSKVDNRLESVSLANNLLKIVKIYPLIKSPYQTEMSKIYLEFNDNSFTEKELCDLFVGYKIEMINKSICLKVSSPIVSFEADLILNPNFRNGSLYIFTAEYFPTITPSDSNTRTT